jgi:hypothetical protein
MLVLIRSGFDLAVSPRRVTSPMQWNTGKEWPPSLLDFARKPGTATRHCRRSARRRLPHRQCSPTRCLFPVGLSRSDAATVSAAWFATVNVLTMYTACLDDRAVTGTKDYVAQVTDCRGHWMDLRRHCHGGFPRWRDFLLYMRTVPCRSLADRTKPVRKWYRYQHATGEVGP